MARDELLQRLAAVGRRAAELSPSDFTTSQGTANQRSRVARLTPDTVLALQDGRSNPPKFGVPAYETFTSDGTGGNTETFTLSHSVVDSPDTQSVVVWLDGTYYGEPDAVDYANNTIDVTDPGTASTVHVYFLSDEAATIEIVKANTEGTASETLFTGSVGLIHATNQNEQPEVLNLSDSGLQRFVAADMDLDVYVDAPYTVAYDEGTDGTEATNALLGINVLRGEDAVPGLLPAVKQDMARR